MAPGPFRKRNRGTRCPRIPIAQPVQSWSPPSLLVLRNRACRLVYRSGRVGVLSPTTDSVAPSLARKLRTRSDAGSIRGSVLYDDCVSILARVGSRDSGEHDCCNPGCVFFATLSRMDPLLIVLTVIPSIILATIIGFAIFEPAIILGDGFSISAPDSATLITRGSAPDAIYGPMRHIFLEKDNETGAMINSGLSVQGKPQTHRYFASPTVGVPGGGASHRTLRQDLYNPAMFVNGNNQIWFREELGSRRRRSKRKSRT